jgi:hypothetical protein
MFAMMTVFTCFSPIQIVPGLTEWLVVKEIVRLDSAVCNKSQRPKLLSWMTEPYFRIAALKGSSLIKFGSKGKTCGSFQQLKWCADRRLLVVPMACLSVELAGNFSFPKMAQVISISENGLCKLVRLCVNFEESSKYMLKVAS